MTGGPFPIVTVAELADAPPPTTHIRTWQGVLSARPDDVLVPPLPDQPHESDYGLFAHFDRSDCLLLDVGANVGQSILSLRCVNRSAQVLSFEPNPVAYAHLAVAAAGHGPAAAFNVGLGASVAVHRLWVPVIDGLLVTPLGSTDLDKLASPAMRRWLEEMAEGRVVHVTPLEIKVLPGDLLGLRPHLVKIDVEGHEPSCVQGLTDTLVRQRPVVMLEQNREAARLLLDLGYVCCSYDADLDLLQDLGQISESHPEWLPLNLVFVHRDEVSRLAVQRGLRVG